MKKSKFKVETLVFALLMTACLFVPSSMHGQNGGADGFFKGGSDGYENREGDDPSVTGGISNDSFEAPLGSGLLVLLVAGTVFALKKRLLVKSLTVVALISGCVQCKKNVDVIHYNKKAVQITLDAGGGAKTNVDPATGEVLFVDGDEIIVANNGAYVGMLTYSDGVFSGTITDPSTDDFLHFYHLGNKYAGVLTEGETASCSVSISDQATFLPVISYEHSTVKYSSGITAYTAKLKNKCALVKFNVTNSSPYAGACIKGMNNKVTVSFSDGTFTFEQESDGVITLPSGEGERWAILLPQDEVMAGGDGSAFSGGFSGTRGAVPEIVENKCFDDGIDVVISTPANPEGALSGWFTVNPQGRLVRFSKGNLSYVRKSGAWRFYNNQCSTFSNNNITVGTDYSVSSITKIEHFGWGCSGFNHGAVFYNPWMTREIDANYYAYGDASKNLDDESGMADWGYNAIENGGNACKQWRTLTADEFEYLINNREGHATKVAYGSIKNVYTYNGLIVLPDDWTLPAGVSFTPGATNFSTNYYTFSDWQKMENNGALFFVAAGRRDEDIIMGPTLFGMYWTTTKYNDSRAYCFFFDTSGITPKANRARSFGNTVRLVIE